MHAGSILGLGNCFLSEGTRGYKIGKARPGTVLKIYEQETTLENGNACREWRMPVVGA